MHRLLRELPTEEVKPLFAWLEEAVDPEVPAPEEWQQLVQHFLERWNQMRILCCTTKVSATTNDLEGRFGRLKPRVRMARSFQTVAGARHFLYTVGHVCA